jgi:hypothetical protein
VAAPASRFSVLLGRRLEERIREKGWGWLRVCSILYLVKGKSEPFIMMNGHEWPGSRGPNGPAMGAAKWTQKVHS